MEATDFNELRLKVEAQIEKCRVKRSLRRQHDKWMNKHKPRYDDVFFKGVKWLDSLWKKLDKNVLGAKRRLRMGAF